MSEDKKNRTILVVDDEPEILSLITDFLDDEGYTVLNAVNGMDALENVLPKKQVDLILSDINMPVMKGFDLLNRVRELYPAVKRVLITAYNVEDYLDLASKHDIGNIFVKTVPFNFNELSILLENLLNEDIFGLERYFEEALEKRQMVFQTGSTIHEDAGRIVDFLPGGFDRNRFRVVLVELLTNAVFYGIRRESAENKEMWNYDFRLSEDEAIVATVMWDKEKFGVSITDKGGRLKKSDVLYWLNRQISMSSEGIPVGIYDTHGRGFFIARKYIDRLIINIKKDVMTEMIIINYFDKIYSGYKPLYINEI